jgi:hypothetical protein
VALEQPVQCLKDIAVPVATAELLERLVNRPAAFRAFIAGARPSEGQHRGGYLVERRAFGVAGTQPTHACERVRHLARALEVEHSAGDRRGGFLRITPRLEAERLAQQNPTGRRRADVVRLLNRQVACLDHPRCRGTALMDRHAATRALFTLHRRPRGMPSGWRNRVAPARLGCRWYCLASPYGWMHSTETGPSHSERRGRLSGTRRSIQALRVVRGVPPSVLLLVGLPVGGQSRRHEQRGRLRQWQNATEVVAEQLVGDLHP